MKHERKSQPGSHKLHNHAFRRILENICLHVHNTQLLLLTDV